MLAMGAISPEFLVLSFCYEESGGLVACDFRQAMVQSRIGSR
jgi:hypothetical protein